MFTPRKLLASFIGVLALTQTGCAALGIAMIGSANPPGAAIDTSQAGDLSVITAGPPTEPGNANVTLTVDLPAFQTQYLLTDVTQVVVGLMDLESKTPYFGYEGPNKVVSDYHAALSDILHDPAEVTLPAGLNIDETSVAKTDASRYLYARLEGKNSYTVKFTNVRANGRKLVAFAAAFKDNQSTKADIIGLAYTTNSINVTTPTTNIGTLAISLNRGLADLGGNVIITPATPSATLTP